MTPAKKKAPAKKAPVKKTAPAKKAPVKKTAPAKKAPVKGKASTRRTVGAADLREPATAPVFEHDPEAPDVAMRPGHREPVVDERSDDEGRADDGWGDDWGDLGWDAPEPPDDDRHDADGPLGPDGTERFQAAARELIDAARTMLDVAEEAIADPRVFRTAFGSLRGFADDVFRVAAQANPMTRRPRNDDDPDEFFRIPVD